MSLTHLSAAGITRTIFMIFTLRDSNWVETEHNISTLSKLLLHNGIYLAEMMDESDAGC